MWAVIVGDCLVGLHILAHRLTGNHCRGFLLQDLPKLLEGVPPSVRTRMCKCMMVLRYILALLGEIFSMTPITTDGEVEEDPLHGPTSPGLNSLDFYCGDTWSPLCMQLLLTTKRYFTIAFGMLVRLSATTPAIYERMRRSIMRCVEASTESHGGHFGNLL
jgi:hypothetical protein